MSSLVVLSGGMDLLGVAVARADCIAPDATLRVDNGSIQALPRPSGAEPQPRTIQRARSSSTLFPPSYGGLSLGLGAGVVPLTGLLRARFALDVRPTWEADFNGNQTEMLDYLYALFCAVSAIYKRDLGVELELAHVQVWRKQEPAKYSTDPFPPVGALLDYWTANFPDCRDPRLTATPCGIGSNAVCCINRAFVFQVDFSVDFGGAAFGDGICGAYAYGSAGVDSRGDFGSPDQLPVNAITGRNIYVLAQEIGHIFTACHTDCSGPYDRPECG